jgi:hypothetical protein
MKLEAIAIAEQGKPFRVVNAKLFRGECDKLSPGRYRITVEKMRKKKSNPQLAWLYGQVYPHVLQGLIDAGWTEITNLDQVDAKCKEMVARSEIINKHTGEIMSVPALKRDMTTVEFSTFVDEIRDWARDYLNVEIPDPESQIKMNYGI